MGPDLNGGFEHDGGEIIFHLPNGMLAYMLTNDIGVRIDVGPIEIVSDPRQPDKTVVNGVSCMSCHFGGFIQKKDEIRNHVLANKKAFDSANQILRLYPAHSLRHLIDGDSKKHLTALARPEIGLAKPTLAGEPVVATSNQFGQEVDLKHAAAELGLSQKQFADKTENLKRNKGLFQAIGPLLQPGGVVKREIFEGSFDRLVSVLARETRVSLDRRLLFKIKKRRELGIPTAVSNTQFPDVMSQRAVEIARKSFEKRKFENAYYGFDAAIRMASDESRYEFCKSAMHDLVKLQTKVSRDARIDFVETLNFVIDEFLSNHDLANARFASNTQAEAYARNFQTSDLAQVIKSFKAQWKLSNQDFRALDRMFAKRLEFDPHAIQMLKLKVARHSSLLGRKKALFALVEAHKANGTQIGKATEVELMKVLAKSGDSLAAAEILKKGETFQSAIRAAIQFKKAGDMDAALKSAVNAEKRLDQIESKSKNNAILLLADTYISIEYPNEAIRFVKPKLIQGKPRDMNDMPFDIEKLQHRLSYAIFEQASELDKKSFKFESTKRVEKEKRDGAILAVEKLTGRLDPLWKIRSPVLEVKRTLEVARKWIVLEEFEKAQDILAAVTDQRLEKLKFWDQHGEEAQYVAFAVCCTQARIPARGLSLLNKRLDKLRIEEDSILSSVSNRYLNAIFDFTMPFSQYYESRSRKSPRQVASSSDSRESINNATLLSSDLARRQSAEKSERKLTKLADAVDSKTSFEYINYQISIADTWITAGDLEKAKHYLIKVEEIEAEDGQQIAVYERLAGAWKTLGDRGKVVELRLKHLEEGEITFGHVQRARSDIRRYIPSLPNIELTVRQKEILSDGYIVRELESLAQQSEANRDLVKTTQYYRALFEKLVEPDRALIVQNKLNALYDLNTDLRTKRWLEGLLGPKAIRTKVFSYALWLRRSKQQQKLLRFVEKIEASGFDDPNYFDPKSHISSRNAKLGGLFEDAEHNDKAIKFMLAAVNSSDNFNQARSALRDLTRLCSVLDRPVPEFAKGLDPRIYRERDIRSNVSFEKNIVELKKRVAQGKRKEGLAYADAAAKQIFKNESKLAFNSELMAKQYRALEEYSKAIEMYELALLETSSKSDHDRLNKALGEVKAISKSAN